MSMAKTASAFLGRVASVAILKCRSSRRAERPASSSQTGAIASTEAGTFKKVAEDWFGDHVEKKRLRSGREIKRHLTTYVYPHWGHVKIFDITRKDANELLREIENKHGASQADAVLATIRSIMGWYAVQDSEYTSPIIRKMQRDKRESRDKARNRTLDHIAIKDNRNIYLEWNDRGEIRFLWAACDEMGAFGALVKLLLLTGQRLRKVARMQFADIVDGVWTIRSDDREKGNAGRLPLPQMALDIIAARPQIAGNPYVFPAERGEGPLNSFSQRKKELDAKLAKEMLHRTLHDLRRTARSLLARVGVPDNIAERVLGHSITDVHGVYNRHGYTEEKADALKRLAAQIETILNPPKGKRRHDKEQIRV
jgi:integrase